MEETPLHNPDVTIELDESGTGSAALLSAIHAGRAAVLTEAGKPVARVTPVAPAEEKMTAEELVEGFRLIRAQTEPMSRDEIVALVKEGRRY